MGNYDLKNSQFVIGREKIHKKWGESEWRKKQMKVQRLKLQK